MSHLGSSLALFQEIRKQTALSSSFIQASDPTPACNIMTKYVEELHQIYNYKISVQVTFLFR
jgi:hypothetical protein